jgi:hypothetical protein
MRLRRLLLRRRSELRFGWNYRPDSDAGVIPRAWAIVGYLSENGGGKDMKGKLKKKVRRWQVAGIETALPAALKGGGGERSAQLYNEVIAATLRFLDKATGNDITGNYPVKYNRLTPLNKIGIPAKSRPMLAETFDREVRETLVMLGHPVEGTAITADDMRHVEKIEDLYRMACGVYSVPVPAH